MIDAAALHESEKLFNVFFALVIFMARLHGYTVLVLHDEVIIEI